MTQRLRGPIRLYVEHPDHVCIAADGKKNGCYHLQRAGLYLEWVRHREGDVMERIPEGDFTAWLDQGGLDYIRHVP